LLFETEGNNLLNGNQGDDTLFGGDSSDTLYGAKGDDLVFAYSGDDYLYGNDNNDTLIAGEGNDNLWGGKGNDTLFGGSGNDLVSGDIGDDLLIGVDVAQGNPGRGEIDTLIGAEGKDKFVLGDANNVYYDRGNNDGGNSDYALIKDFNSKDDVILVHGSPSDYQITAVSNGMGIFWKKPGNNNELIAIVEGASSLSLKSVL
jgi:Ca2+-binding RTX toxin-like protein